MEQTLCEPPPNLDGQTENKNQDIDWAGYRVKIGVGYVVHYPFSCKTVIGGNYLVVIGACCSESTLN